MKLNTDWVTQLGDRILAIRRSSRLWTAILAGLSALFATIAALAALRIVRRYAALMEFRVSELQHFSARLAHDIRSPLASVGLALDLARRNPVVEPKTQAALARGSGTLQRVGQLVDGLLLFALAGSAPQAGASARTAEVVGDVIDGLSPSARDKHALLQVTRLDDARVACSPGVLISVISNLVGNAIKYLGDATERRVEVRVEDRGEQVWLQVADTGPGIDPAVLPRVFEPYTRAAQSGVPGLGLGLATVRRLVEAHGGLVGVESQLGAGSRFFVELPKAPLPARA